ncbi:ABC transporter permease [Luethyella okanaganae]|uniref:ABC transporter permease n=1 Tax=Luethyella okanaganae TaxID=69372 RepID=A0ABW1VJ73_9MICO
MNDSNSAGFQVGQAVAPVRMSRLLGVYVRTQVVELVRLPIAMATAIGFPIILFIIFAAGGSPSNNVANWAMIVVLASGISAVALYHLGAGIAEERANAWDPYQRTLARPYWLVLLSRVLTAFIFIVAGALPVVALGYWITDVDLPLERWPATAGLLALGAVIMSLLGVAIGYSFGGKSAIGFATVLLFPMLWLGGFFGSYETLPEWAKVAAEFVPTRHWSAALLEAVGDGVTTWLHIWMLLVWLLGLAGLAFVAVWRDATRSTRS